jgi:hypothetical protein
MTHLEQNEILCPQQHGFRKQRSCETQLIELVEELTSDMASGQRTDVLVLDFAKAFDKVNHSLLQHKLNSYGVRGKINKWISNFLANRRQAVVVEGAKSDSIDVKSGVPQGSVLGPCLFLVFINDLPEKLTSNTRMFADDTAIYRTIASKEDHAHLQEDLERLQVWEQKWEMAFNPGKCATLRVTRCKSTISDKYQMHGHTLTTVQSASYLGVTLRTDLEWAEHIDSITKKASKALGFLRRNLKVASNELREKAYLTFVRPLLEYSSSVWDPHKGGCIKKMENIQRRAARFVLNRYHRRASVTEMLEKLKWPSLQKRRQATRVTMLYKIHNDLVQVNKSVLEKPVARDRRSHNQQFKRLVRHKQQYRLFSFFPRAIREWDELPAHIVEADSPNSFKNRVTSHLNANTLDSLAAQE